MKLRRGEAKEEENVDKIILEIAYLGGQGGHYYGYMPVIQGDSARPYEERSYIQFIKRNCEGKAWYW